MMPTMGNLTLVVAALSYAGQLNLTAAADRDHCQVVAVRQRSEELIAMAATIRTVSGVHADLNSDLFRALHGEVDLELRALRAGVSVANQPATLPAL
jgi:hypothetical protein